MTRPRQRSVSISSPIGEHPGIAIGAGIDAAIETADAVFMPSDPPDAAVALETGRGTFRKMPAPTLAPSPQTS